MVANPRSRLGNRPGGSPRPLTRVAARVLPLLALVAIPAGAQIVKCTDAEGNVLYQNEAACPKNTKAGRVDIFDNTWTADSAEKDAAWRRQASEHHVVAGMPVRWVREALGEPSEVRKTETAGADEVWLYNLPDRSAQVGVLADRVLWFREGPVIAPVARSAPEPVPAAAQASHAAAEAVAPSPAQILHAAPDLTAPAAPVAAPAAPVWSDGSRPAAEGSLSAQASPKISESRHGIARGQDCSQVLAELGPPDRQRDVPAFDKASDPVTEYFYEPAGGAGSRTRIVCANGKVEGVDRAISH
jgi:Domain of unknown function (DUF4124)